MTENTIGLLICPQKWYKKCFDTYMQKQMMLHSNDVVNACQWTHYTHAHHAIPAQ